VEAQGRQGKVSGGDVRGVRLYWRRLARRPAALVGTVVFLTIVLLAAIGPTISPYPPNEQDAEAPLEAPSGRHFFGTDQFGRDVFSRVLSGARGVVTVSGLGTAMAVAIGVFSGLFAGYQRGVRSEIITRVYDLLLCIPSLLLAMVLIASVGPSKVNTVLVVGILYTPNVGRVVRSVVLDLKSKEFVEAAKARKERRGYILFREILPNTLGPLMVESAMRFSYSIFLVASLGFLGLGVQPPASDWGLMVSDARDFLQLAPWMLLFPAAAIAALVIATNLMSDGLRQITAPAGSAG
jgi:peptide/nickel transport system permease protein